MINLAKTEIKIRKVFPFPFQKGVEYTLESSSCCAMIVSNGKPEYICCGGTNCKKMLSNTKDEISN